MRSKYIWILVSIAAATTAVVVVVFAGDPDSPPGPPESTYSYTLEDIYRRLDTGTAGTPITFTEPISGPGTGTMHTLDEIIAMAPAVDDTNGAINTQVLTDTTAWGLTGGAWGVMTGTMPDNGAVTFVPTTTTQTVAAGYHSGAGYVEGDADLVAGNIKSGANIFGVNGTYVGGPPYPGQVPKTGQTISHATGDDGDLEVGIDWPNPRFITDITGVVTDALTGLVWLENANCFGRKDWSTALTDANSLASGSCGLTDGSSAGDWRLPNVRELCSLIDYSHYNPALPSGHPFANVQEDFYYWSSTSFANAPASAWIVYVYNGTVYFTGQAYTFHVWPVRGGQ